MIWRALIGVISKLFLSAAMLAASWFGGRKAAQTDAKVEELTDYVETRKRMDAMSSSWRWMFVHWVKVKLGIKNRYD